MNHKLVQRKITVFRNQTSSSKMFYNNISLSGLNENEKLQLGQITVFI